MAIAFHSCPSSNAGLYFFLLMSFAYHSDMMLIKGANSKVSGFSLSIPLLTAIKRTLFRLNISISVADLEIVAPPARQVFHMQTPIFPFSTSSIMRE